MKKQLEKYEDICISKEKQNRCCLGDRTNLKMLKSSKKGC